MTNIIVGKNVSFQIQKYRILEDISFHLDKGEFVGIIGPNGSGKSTLLKNIYKIYKPTSGLINLYDKDIESMSNRDTANKISVVAQENDANFDFTVKEVVAMGRYPKKNMLDTLTEKDNQIIIDSIKKVAMEKFLNSSFLDLSGGEKQRVIIARALAQETDVIIMDEPTNHLDIGSQINALELIKNSGKSILAALHDLAVAINYCDRIYVLYNGKVLCSGKPSEVITKSLIYKLYGVHAEVFQYDRKTFVNYQPSNASI